MQEIKLSDNFTYKKLIRFVIPSVVMMIFTSVYGVVDGLCVSNFVGKTPFAALNLIMPFIMMLGAVGFMLGAGGSALVSKTLGEHDNDRANRYFSMIIILDIVAGVILAVAGIIFIEPVARLLGATDDMLPYCVAYGRIVLIGTPAFMLQNAFQSFLITAEKPKLGLYVTVAAGVMNIVLDLLFVAAFGWKIEGAAIATVISQCVGGFLPFFYFARKNPSILRFHMTRLEAIPLLKASANGSSELMSNISSSLVSMLYNYQLMQYAGEDGVSAYGVIMYINFIFIAAFIGYSIGSAPIVGYNYGAQNREQLKSLLRKSLVIIGVSGVAMTALAELLAYPLTMLFAGYDKALFDLTLRGFMIFSISFLLCGFNIYGSAFFTALNNGAVSAIISFLRTLVFQLAALFLLPLIWDVDGIFAAIIAAEIMALILTAIFLVAKRKKYGYF